MRGQGRFSELAAAFLEYSRIKLRDSSFEQRQWQLRGFCRYVEKLGKGLSDVTTADIEAYLSTKSHCAPLTRREYFSTIRRFYVFLCEQRSQEFRRDNPAAPIRFKRIARRRVTLVPGPQQIRAALSRLAGAHDPLSVRVRAMAELGYGSGLRRCELVALNVEDIDFQKRRAYIRGKGDYTRMVPLTSAALAAIGAYLGGRGGVSEGPLFVGRRGARLSPVSVNWLFRKMVGIRPHMLRHGCATHMLLNGCDTRSIQELLGHKYLTTTQVYTHIIPVDVERVVKSLHPRACTDKNDCNLPQTPRK